MKKIATLVALSALLLFTACAPRTPAVPEDTNGKKEKAAITLWTYPIGGWATASSVSPILTSFRIAHPEISVSVEYVSYAGAEDPHSGDTMIENAIENGGLPDVVFEGPERLVANWGARGLMAPLNDLWEDETAKEVDSRVAEACHDSEGNYYVVPLCMTTHCMAVNRNVFEQANALQYLDIETRTWTADGFQKAVAAIKAYYDGLEAQGETHRDVAAVYCEGKGGDQGTRALVNNLCGGRFTDAAHTKYTVNSEENIEALTLLKGMEGIRFDPALDGTKEHEAFCAGELAMSFCWNVAVENSQLKNHPDIDFDILPMAFPSQNGTDPKLQGGIWGFGVFDNGDEARLKAAKTFIRFLTETDYTRAVTVSSYSPVREISPDPYANDALMTEYAIFKNYFGDFYQITPEWDSARTAWCTLLQEVGSGADIRTALGKFPETFSAVKEN